MEKWADLKDLWRLRNQSLRTGRWAGVESGRQLESALSVPPHVPNAECWMAHRSVLCTEGQRAPCEAGFQNSSLIKNILMTFICGSPRELARLPFVHIKLRPCCPCRVFLVACLRSQTRALMNCEFSA